MHIERAFELDKSQYGPKPTSPEVKQDIVRALEAKLRLALKCPEDESVYAALRDKPTAACVRELLGHVNLGVLKVVDRTEKQVPSGDQIARWGDAIFRLNPEYIQNELSKAEQNWRHDGGIKQLLAFYREETPLVDIKVGECLRALDSLVTSSRQKSPQDQEAQLRHTLDGIMTSPAVSIIVELVRNHPQTFGRSQEAFVDALTQITRFPLEDRKSVNEALGEQVSYYIQRHYS